MNPSLLTAIGFTEYESKIYIELLREYPATGYQLGKSAGVPRSMVYEALGRLSNRGAVLETMVDRAMLYRPIPPEVLLDNHEREQQRLSSNLREKLHQIYSAKQEDYLWSVSGSRSTLAYSVQMLRESQKSLLLVLNDAAVEHLQNEISLASRRGVEVKALLTGTSELGVGQVVRHPPLESELQHLTGMMMIIADESEVLISDSGEDTSATITKNRNLVLIASQFVWMELFAQRLYGKLGRDLLERLDEEDRKIFESLRLPGAPRV